MKMLSFQNGDKMPMLGLGTWKSEPGDVYQAVLWAIEAGYRHIDCAAIYQNEKEIGDALKKALSENMVKREELFITSKLWNNAHLKEDVHKGLKQTLEDLQLEYLDLYLIHWPVSLKREVVFPKEPKDFLTYEEAPIIETWKQMEVAKKEGLIRHIGVSNFNRSKLDEILQNAVSRPEMNQIELHPFLPQNGLVDFCNERKIHVTAYAPLGSADRPSARRRSDEPVLLDNEAVNQIADKHRVTAAQVLIKWSIQRGTAVIPKSVNKDRIKQNFEAVKITLDEDDILQLNALDKNFRFVDGAFFTFEGSPYSQEDLWEWE